MKASRAVSIIRKELGLSQEGLASMLGVSFTSVNRWENEKTKPRREVAKRIDDLLSEVVLLQQDYVARICPACEKPCCSRVRRLFDEKDIIFAKVSRQEGVPRRKHKSKKGCPFLSATGCLLAPKARPFACHRYLCSKLQKEMAWQEPELLPMMFEKFRMLEHVRGQLWSKYLETMAAPRKKRESMNGVKSALDS